MREAHSKRFAGVTLGQGPTVRGYPSSRSGGHQPKTISPGVPCRAGDCPALSVREKRSHSSTLKKVQGGALDFISGVQPVHNQFTVARRVEKPPHHRTCHGRPPENPAPTLHRWSQGGGPLFSEKGATLKSHENPMTPTLIYS